MQKNSAKRPRLAVVALALGLAAWALPAAPVVVVVLAVIAFAAAKSAPQARKMAAGAMALGVLGLSLQGYVGFGLYQDLNRGPAQATAHSVPAHENADPPLTEPQRDETPTAEPEAD